MTRRRPLSPSQATARPCPWARKVPGGFKARAVPPGSLARSARMGRRVRPGRRVQARRSSWRSRERAASERRQALPGQARDDPAGPGDADGGSRRADRKAHPRGPGLRHLSLTIHKEGRYQLRLNFRSRDGQRRSATARAGLVISLRLVLRSRAEAFARYSTSSAPRCPVALTIDG